MRFEPNFNQIRGNGRSLVARATLLLALLAGACGGGGLVPYTGVAVRTLPAEFSARHAVAYGPFRSANRSTETVTSAEILQDMNLLLAGNFRLIRLFDSSDATSAPNGGSSQMILDVIRNSQLDIKVQLGVYIQSDQYADPHLSPAQQLAVKNAIAAQNQAEIQRAIALANKYADIILTVSVGNENMVSWSFNPVDPTVMQGFLSAVRSKVPQPVTSDDNWLFYSSAPDAILNNIDFVSMHSYVLLDTIYSATKWDWKQQLVPMGPARAQAMMAAAIVATQADFTAVRSYLNLKGRSDLAVVIGETGWKALPSGGEYLRASPVNQRMYFDGLSAWRDAARTSGAGLANIFYFEAFDEPWKQGDDSWGLFNVGRQARCTVQALSPAYVAEAGSCADADAVYFKILVSNPRISAGVYSAYADNPAAGAFDAWHQTPAPYLAFNAWQGGNGGTASWPQVQSAFAPGDGPNSIMITPSPDVWGWGLALGLTDLNVGEDLTNFAGPTGALNFWIKTTYPGTLEVGFLTGSTATVSAADVYIQVTSGSFGYVNDGAWHKVSIPVTSILAHAAPAFGMPSTVTADITRVSNLFVIAERYANTGDTAHKGDTTPIYIDNITWSR
jgi:exo-beta-1,3-glucanase (GH17 family)